MWVWVIAELVCQSLCCDCPPQAMGGTNFPTALSSEGQGHVSYEGKGQLSLVQKRAGLALHGPQTSTHMVHMALDNSLHRNVTIILVTT